MKKYLKLVFDFLLPRLCITCEKKINFNENIICSSCYSNIELADKSRLEREFNKNFRENKIIKEIASSFIFTDDSVIQQLIHSLKYDQNFSVGIFLGTKSAQIFKNKILHWNADIIIPIPLHKLRKIERGFNQATEIAKGLSRVIEIPVKNKIIKRIKFTDSQTKLSKIERKVNMKNAFEITNSKAVIDKKIILIDDVITTGATISECANQLLQKGAKEIFALSVAIAD